MSPRTGIFRTAASELARGLGPFARTGHLCNCPTPGRASFAVVCSQGRSTHGLSEYLTENILR